jgi:hypothetical protein
MNLLFSFIKSCVDLILFLKNLYGIIFKNSSLQRFYYSKNASMFYSKNNYNLTNYGQNEVQKQTPGLGGLTRQAAEIYSIFRFLGNFSCFCKKMKRKNFLFLEIWRHAEIRRHPCLVQK